MNIATYEAQFEATSLAKAATAGVRFDAALPRATALCAAVLRKPLSIRGTDGSKLIKPFIKDWTTAERTRNTGTIRQGFFKGQTNFQIIQKSRGTAVLKYADAFRLRHTVARQRWFERRAARRRPGADGNCQGQRQCRATDRVVATLDSKICQICRSLESCRLPVDSEPRRPSHPNWTTFVLITQFSEMFGQGAPRSAHNEQINAALYYYHWLQRQPASFQDAAIGPVRAELFRDGERADRAALY